MKTTLLTFLIVFLPSCGSSQLTRAKAKEVIEKAYPPVTEITIAMPEILKLSKLPADHVLAVAQTKLAKPCTPLKSDVRLMTGQLVICPYPAHTVTPSTFAISSKLVKPGKMLVVEVTGMSDLTATEKLIEYTWQFDYSLFPADIAEALSLPPETGKALVRLYDDGWRFVEFR